ncbi:MULTISPECIES: glycosyltransferase family 4 protein [unclassified Pseudomonas]|uniref:glycosyltransferase family 4 protein n=1 Tax=unclassified Pseudomonas TaxID=196821 RepID=UPI002AC950CD|nr:MULTISPECIES: glycosyltransferase family 4 protein [unclassified Pseudomonas]MEB0048301.1 glycosyltransferase family 4 protein [Pseudomonas sp. Dout3]MEB0099051.1 glycosyltransferase family 4 protein [Pseudomonas sp. DC1.2]WPX56951.1 glycosyltransferase family 4 protein [Pseudomonas sp. DC1.2]
MNTPLSPTLPIIHLLSSGGFYGAERMLLDHCLATPGQHQVLFLDAPPALIARFQEAGVNCQGCAGLGPLLGYLRQRRAERPLINTHNFKGLLFGWVGATFLRLPLVITQHGFTPRSRKQRFYTWLSLQLCRTASVDRVVCVAESIALLHRQASVRAEKLQVIPNGLPATTARQPHNARRQRWLAGYVGRLSSEKGPDLFLDALITLCRQHPQLDGVMLGDGPERDNLLARINAAGLQDRITLPGYQTDMGLWWRQLDALVISSRTEGTPMILLEAMQAGVPVVAFAVGGIPDVLEDHHNGLLAAPTDSAALARHIATLLSEPALARTLSDNARRTQLDRYDLKALAERWSQLYIRTAREARA